MALPLDAKRPLAKTTYWRKRHPGLTREENLTCGSVMRPTLLLRWLSIRPGEMRIVQEGFKKQALLGVAVQRGCLTARRLRIPA